MVCETRQISSIYIAGNCTSPLYQNFLDIPLLASVFVLTIHLLCAQGNHRCKKLQIAIFSQFIWNLLC